MYMTRTPATTPLATVAVDRSPALLPRAAAREEKPNLDDHLQDRTGADRESERRPVRREGVAAKPDARDGRQARERGQGNEGRQPGPPVDQGRDDADALGDVVEREAEHQEGAKRGGAGGERRADRQPLAEVVDADAERDRGRERHPLEPAALAAPERQQEHRGERGDQPDHGPAVEARCRLPRQLERLLERVDQKEQEQPDGERQREIEGGAAAGSAAPDRTASRARPAGRRRTGRPGPSAPRLPRVGVGTATSMVCSKATPLRLSITTWCVSPCTQGYGTRSHAVDSRGSGPGGSCAKVQ